MKNKLSKIVNIRLVTVVKFMLIAYVAFCIVNTTTYLAGTRVHLSNVFELTSPIVEAKK